MTAPVIRRATTSDAALLARIGAEFFAAAFGAQNDPNDLKVYLARAFAPAKQEAELADPNRVTWIAESVDGTPAGYAMIERGSASPAVMAHHPIELLRFY